MTLLGALEANLSIICACLLTFPPLMNFFARWTGPEFSSTRVGLKDFISSFSSKSRKPSPGSMRLNSSSAELHCPEGREKNMPTDGDLESARTRPQHNRLYPSNDAIATRTSLEVEYGWLKQPGRSQARVEVDDSWKRELNSLGQGVESHSSINVIKSWRVNKE
jgi:hypothetical protein